MFRKLLVAALAAFTLSAASMTATAPAEARSNGYFFPHHGGGNWGGGGRRWYGRGYGRRWRDDGWGWGAGLALAPLLMTPGLYGGYGGGYYDDGYYDYAPACRWRRVRIYTDYGWRIRRQRVCYQY